MRFQNDGWEPKWDVDLAYGKDGEAYLFEVFPEVNNGRTESKRKRYVDEMFYVEYECRRADGWQPSGIQTTAAAIWVFVIDDTGMGVVVPTPTVYACARQVGRDPSRLKQCVIGSHPTKGVLVSFQDLIKFQQGYEAAA